MTTLASRTVGMLASSRCSPATPTSFTRTTSLPMKSAVSAASSATGKSLVPAHSTAMVPGRLAKRLASTAMHRADSWCTASGNCPRTAAAWSALARVISTRSSRSITLAAMAATWRGVFPEPKIISGNPCRSDRWASTCAKPRSSIGAAHSTRSTSASSISPAL